MFPALLEGGAGFTVTADMFSGLTDTITNNASVIVPVGLGVMGIIVSIKIIPKIINKFV